MTKKQEIWLFILFPVLLTLFGTFMTYPNIWPTIFSFAIPVFSFAIPVLSLGFVIFYIVDTWQDICEYDWRSLGKRILKFGLAVFLLLAFLDLLEMFSKLNRILK